MPGFQYDVFISYAQMAESDWVRSFQEVLQEKLTAVLTREAKVFWDRAVLRGDSQLNPEIEQAVRSTGVLVVLMSRAYLTRPWCTKERETFLAKPAGQRGRVLLVNLEGVRPDDWPADIRQLDCTGFKFWESHSERKNVTRPLPVRGDSFDWAIRDLAESIGTHLKALAAAPEANAAEQPAGPTVFMADGLANPTLKASQASVKQAGVWPDEAASGDIRLPDGSWTIELPAEREAVKHLRKLRISVALKGGRQMGKSLLADRIARRMDAVGWRRVGVDLRHEFADADYETGDGFLRRLAKKIGGQAGVDEASLAVFDRDDTPTAFKTFFEALRDSHPHDRYFLILDRVDALSSRPCCSGVLNGLRLLHDAQSTLRQDAWLQMLLIHTVRPRQTGTIRSIFPAAREVEITDFSQGELQKLATLYGLPGVDIAKLHAFLGGHPFLSQLAFMAMQDDGVTLDEITAGSRTGGIFKQHLNSLTAEFREIPDARRLADSFRDLVLGNKLKSDESFDALLALGVVKGTGKCDAEVRCELYRTWLPPRIPR